MSLDLSVEELVLIRNALGTRSLQLDEFISAVEASIDEHHQGLCIVDKPGLMQKSRHRASLVLERDGVQRLDSKLLRAIPR